MSAELRWQDKADGTSYAFGHDYLYVRVPLAQIVPSFQGKLVLGLSTRQRAVANGIVLGQTNKEIANGLGISERTVKFHVGKLMRNLNASSRGECARRMMTLDGGIRAAREQP
jgi:DNA-binding NarL/FixJ family response regulator